MDPETNHQTNHQFRRLPKSERRVRFADSMGMELVSIFLFDLINTYYFASIHNNKRLPPPPPPSPSPPPPTTRPYSGCTVPQFAGYQKAANVQPTLNTSIKVDSNSSYSSSSAPKSSSQVISQPKPAGAVQVPQYICQFTQPISLISFKERVKLNKVHLETCSIQSGAGNLSITCTIRVLNQSYDKSVIVRYTTDEWHSYTDSLASYKPGSCDGWSDKFTSTFSLGSQAKEFQTGQRIIFAIKYTYDGDNTSWDNNGGLNYTVKKI